MKLNRILCGLGLSLMLVASTGCGQKTVILPTDEEARKRAEPQPPPPVAFGGNPNAKNGGGGDNQLKTVGIPSPDSKAGEKK
jgi:hypothetical protein